MCLNRNARPAAANDLCTMLTAYENENDTSFHLSARDPYRFRYSCLVSRVEVLAVTTITSNNCWERRNEAVQWSRRNARMRGIASAALVFGTWNGMLITISMNRSSRNGQVERAQGLDDLSNVDRLMGRDRCVDRSHNTSTTSAGRPPPRLPAACLPPTKSSSKVVSVFQRHPSQLSYRRSSISMPGNSSFVHFAH